MLKKGDVIMAEKYAGCTVWGTKHGNSWAVSYTCLQVGTGAVSEALNSYCASNNCVPVSISITYNSKSFGGAIEVAAIVKKE